MSITKQDRLDWVSHLAVELGLVLCTVSILTKARMFWFGGIVAAVAGVYFAVTALGMGPHGRAAEDENSSSEAHSEGHKEGSSGRLTIARSLIRGKG